MSQPICLTRWRWQ